MYDIYLFQNTIMQLSSFLLCACVVSSVVSSARNSNSNNSNNNNNNNNRRNNNSPNRPPFSTTQPTAIGDNQDVCLRVPSDTEASKTPGDNGFRIKLVGQPQPDGYIGGQVYTGKSQHHYYTADCSAVEKSPWSVVISLLNGIVKYVSNITTYW